MFVQLNPIIPVHAQDKGKGYAFAVIDYGAEHHLIWVITLDDSGEIWCVANLRIRMQNNWTLERVVRPAGTVEAFPDPPTQKGESR